MADKGLGSKILSGIGGGLREFGKDLSGSSDQSSDSWKSAGDSVRDMLKRGEETVRTPGKGTVVGDRESNPVDVTQSFKKGGRVARTGNYKLHAGEVVVPKKLVGRLEKLRKSSRKSGRR